MSIFDYLQESLIAEKLPLKTAKHYVKKGKENVKSLPEEFTNAYDKMFGNKSRIQIGKMKVPIDDIAQKDITHAVRELNTFMRKNPNPNIPEDQDNIVLDVLINKLDPENNKYVDLTVSSDGAKKELAQAYDSAKGKYLLKTVIKRLKKYVDKNKHNELSQMAGQILTKSSNISQVDEAPVVLSRHPYDVAGMSTAKRWQSCKDTVTGCNRSYLDNEVGHLLIAFVVNPNRKGKDLLNDPYARLLVLPVEGDEGYGLFVSPDIYKYGGNFDELHTIVEKYVSNFMTTYYAEDEKTAVGDYYKDSGFEDDEIRMERLYDQIGEITDKVRNAPSNFDQDMTDYIRNRVEEDGYDKDPGDVIQEVLIDEFDKLFRILVDITSNYDMAVDYYDEYMQRDFDRLLKIIDEQSVDAILREYLLFHYSELTTSANIMRAVSNEVIDDITTFMMDIIDNDGAGSLSQNSKLLKAVVEYVIENDDASLSDGRRFLKEINLDELWEIVNDDDEIDINDYYSFARRMGLTDKEILQYFDASDFSDYETIKAHWDEQE